MSKRTKEFEKLSEKDKLYTIEEAVAILKKAPRPKFNETVEISLNINSDPKQADQMVRGTVILPHGSGKKVKVLVLCKGEGANQAREAGAEYVGDADLISKITGGWIDFDVVISAPDMMREVGKLGRVLGPRGLMPNPKTGTVTNDFKRAIEEAKAGKVEFKLNKLGNINVIAGKISFEEKAIVENASKVITAIDQSRPSGIKGKFIKNIALSTTMGPGVKLDLIKLRTS